MRPAPSLIVLRQKNGEPKFLHRDLASFEHPLYAVSMGVSWQKVVVALFLFGLISSALYSNTFEHEFHLDSTYGLKQNEAIRSLDRIPSYFTDPFTLTSLRQNADYRPILQVTYALNYAISGYDMWSWHAFQILLHVLNALFLVLLASRWLTHLTREEQCRATMWLPWIFGLIFLVHPTASGVVNYLWARSSLLTATFILPGLLLWMNDRTRWAAVFYGLALFTKVEAVGAVGAFLLWDVFRANRRYVQGVAPGKVSFLGDVWTLVSFRTLRRLAPIILITAIYGVIRVQILPDFLTESRSDADVTAFDYLMTQTTAWWHYVSHWWAPISLVADDLSYPVFRSLAEPRVLLSIVGWSAVAFGLRQAYGTRPGYLIVALTALALISPTSSIAPLSEMVNEHRPYLPVAVFSMLWVIPLGFLALRLTRGAFLRRIPVALCLILGLMTLCVTTFERNKAFLTWETYWKDVVAKAPGWRAHLNVGWWHMGRGEYDDAERGFKNALRFAPNNMYALTNLAMVYAATKRDREALSTFEKAVSVDRFNSIASEAKGRFHLNRKEYRAALGDLVRAEARTMKPYDLYRDIATSAAGAGFWRVAVKYTLKCRSLDEERTRSYDEIVKIVKPFWRNKVSREFGIQYFKKLAKAWPKQWWVHGNLAILTKSLGLKAEAARQRRLKETYQNQ